MFEYQGFREYLENTQYQSCVFQHQEEDGGRWGKGETGCPLKLASSVFMERLERGSYDPRWPVSHTTNHRELFKTMTLEAFTEF